MPALPGAISSDIDTLHSLYKGHGLRRDGYTYAEMAIGLENFSRFLEPYGVKATLFMVGHDFLQPQNHAPIRAVADEGHEIANHSMTHAQGFRLLPPAEMEREVAGMEEACEALLGRRPTGFRSPGWNIGDQAIEILMRRGYAYDSSVHPTSLMPLFKLLHWRNTTQRTGGDRTAMGQLDYMCAPISPYRSSRAHLRQRGADGIVELPVTVVPVIRLPFWATFLLATGLGPFTASLALLRSFGVPVQFQFHLSDFVDFNHPEFADQVPRPGDGVYVPQALWTPLEAKREIFTRAMDRLAEHYTFTTLAQWAEGVA
ncbi:MAG: polysaccharide deacetylase family protein [Vicinamibacterales bacterium]|nr:polysaccharide deacetylase family protein [Vicinamibacterales bacterium]